MIRALVVDDEKLVRKGFISIIDWASHGIVIVGEASDGAAALEWMNNNEVDLLFTDITMPRMDGFELIRQVRQQFPHMQSVVLTCHHEFDYVQEAMRLGAIDYIVKTLLEVDSSDSVISRIVERCRWERGKIGGAAETASRQAALSVGQAIAFVPRERGGDSGELFRLPLAKGSRLIQLSAGVWLTQPASSYTAAELDRELGDRLLACWRPVIVTGIEGGAAVEEAGRLVEDSKLLSRLFYAPEKSGTMTLAIGDLKPRYKGSSADAQLAAAVPNQWHTLRWALHTEEWKTMLAEAERLEIQPEAWHTFAGQLFADWSGLLFTADERVRMLEESSRNRTWRDWRDWLGRVSSLVRSRTEELAMSREVMGCLIGAVIYMRQHAGDKINQSDVATHVSMSRSYFSQCFAKLAGASFGDTLRAMRIDLAKRLLQESDAPVYEIAERAGFEDDKYFSRVFREHVGLLPSEYRTAKR
ncbi:two-component system response regulator YesN [Paenibacillus cellulosilyticus]|uniref:Two-component system response regulator YesN n=1 Tax=Paenibacillus cellulosilyticus TaxID=375489 RepID=A0A2V2YQ68_9BACL|nr:response regulator [Paenibacillus cellulosilyticus]PWV98617.1 two-component system response regulator YesN [Paenibacillus cellulosilyticus]QKS43865.1 response regulator [Paenibacillus cellulosilyticus]